MKTNAIVLLVCIPFSFYGCIDPYEIPNVDKYDDLIVIDASLNATTGEASVKLSRSQPLDAQEPIDYISGAFVAMTDDDGTNYILDQNQSGDYVGENIFLQGGDSVQLSVRTKGGGEYVSDFVEFKETPEIDSITYSSDKDGVMFYVTTHDPKNETHYYKWEFEETWEFHAKYISSFEYNYLNDTTISVFPRERADTLYWCYQSDTSEQIIVASSKRLSKDVISEYPFAFIDNSTGKFVHRYSILVKQRALTEESYNYWSLLQSNTESVGSIFDPQPSKINSNIVSVSNPDEDVLGYFSVYSETQARIDLDRFDVEPHSFTTGYESCETDSVMNEDLLTLLLGRFIVAGIFEGGPSPVGYTVSSRGCVDCTLRGTNKKPKFWN